MMVCEIPNQTHAGNHVGYREVVYGQRNRHHAKYICHVQCVVQQSFYLVIHAYTILCRKEVRMILLGLLGCGFQSIVPETPQCTAQKVFFSPQLTDISQPRSWDDGYHNDGPSVAIFDLDRDGASEIFQCFPGEETYIYTLAGRTKIFDRCGAMVVDDINRDGWDDLLRVDENEQDEQYVYVLENRSGALHEVASFSVGFEEVRSLRIGDVNRDGRSDLLITRNGFREDSNDRDILAYGGSGWDFSVDEEALEQQHAARKAFDAMVVDIDQDGWQDLYVANDRGYEFGGNVAWFNENGSFQASQDCGCMPVQDAMGVDIADYNHDGILDIVTSDVHRTHLYEGLGNGDFVDMTQVRGANGMDDWEMNWGIRFVDVNNDGLMEIFSGQGDHTYEGNDMPEYEGDMGLSLQAIQSDVFEDVQDDYGFDQQGSFRSIVPFHWNGDGVLDYWITQANNASVLMSSNGCSDGAWLFVQGPSGVAVRFDVGAQKFYGEVQGASSYAASESPQVHFGLGDADMIENVEIRYPGQGWEMIHQQLAVPADLTLSYP